MPALSTVKLSVNVDHVATLRQARRAPYPDPVEAARLAEDAGASGITAHLRADRRHIQDNDVERLRASVRGKLNLEMSVAAEMLAVAGAVRPDQVTLVPERPEEITTEGGLVFIAGAPDSRIRAFNVENGKEVWDALLPAAGNATPMTYEINGKQYLVIAAGGHQRIPEESLGDSLVAFALP